jgi:F-type H+-transporting ATPase subunit b
MESTLHALAGLLLKAVPTIFLLLVVHFYLKSMFFRPMGEVLAKRRAATEGLHEAAAATRAKAAEQTASIEAQLRQAREEIYQEQEEARRRSTTEQSNHLDQARTKARDLVRQSRDRLDAEASTARKELTATAESLADEIAGAILKRSAA